ncbi:MAG: hypothetical protein HGB30_04925 [Holophagaceae bacterium]|nr:hypothetical protein [Holophagaceae bacterium]
MLRPLLLLSLLSASALPGLAQGAPADEGRPLARFRMDQLQQSVGLPEDQARLVVERWTRYDREQFDRTQVLHQVRRKFNDILLGPGSEEEKNARVRPLLEQFVDLRRQQAELKFRFEDDIRGKLSPAQQVRLILRVEEMQRQMADVLRQNNVARPGLRQGPGRRGNP